MENKISLKDAERKVFVTRFQDGMLDIFLGCVALELVIGPYLSVYLGDFWASAIFLPFWGLAFLVIWLVRRTIIQPRIGRVQFGAVRKARLMKFNLVMLSVNIILLVLGIAAFSQVPMLSGFLVSNILGITLLVGFTLAGFFLDVRRLYVYGLLGWLAPVVGEWLWQRGLASHHGFPIAFGFLSAVLILTGLFLFVRLLLNTTPAEDAVSEEA